MGTARMEITNAILLCGGPSIKDVSDQHLRELASDHHIMSVNFRAVEAGLPMHSNVSADGTWWPEDRQPRPWANEFMAKWSPTIMLDPDVEVWRRYQFRLSLAWLDAAMTLEELPNVHFYRGVLTHRDKDPKDFLGQPHAWIGELPLVLGKRKNIVTCRCSMFPAFKILWDKGVRKIYLVGCEFHDPDRAHYWERLTEILQRLKVQFDERGLEVYNTYPDCGVFPHAVLPR